MAKRGSQVGTSVAEFARTGAHWRIEPPFGEPRAEFTQTGAIAVLVVMAHPKRRAHWEKLRAQLQNNGFPVCVVVDEGGGILANAENVLATMAAADAAQESWCVVVEDDVRLTEGLPARLSALLATIPAGVAGFSLHNSNTARGNGWKRRKRGELLRTQFAGWRRGYTPRLLEALRRWRRDLKKKTGWDKCCSGALDADGLQSVISVPSYVQHGELPSLLGNVMAKAPRFAEVMP